MKPPNVTYLRQIDLKNVKNDLSENDLKWDFPLGSLEIWEPDV